MSATEGCELEAETATPGKGSKLLLKLLGPGFGKGRGTKAE